MSWLILKTKQFFDIIRLSVETYNGLESWFKLDSQFLPHFIYCWSSRAYEYLFTVIDPFFSISRAALSLTSENNSEIVSLFAIYV